MHYTHSEKFVIGQHIHWKTMTKTSDPITSTSNPLIKRLRSLERKKIRAETGLFLAEGARLVTQGLNNGWQIDTLLVSADMADRNHIQDLMQHAQSDSARVETVPARLLSRITRKDNTQSVIAAFRQEQRSLADLNTSANCLFVALYEVRDPGNLGTILRTADCAGADGVILLETCCDPYSFEAVRASMGSLFDLPFTAASMAEFNAWREASSLSLIAASVNGNVRHDRARFGDASIILMGNEQAGLPNEIEAKCDTLALIPMRGGADSLNLAQSTAIMVYEAWRQRDFK